MLDLWDGVDEIEPEVIEISSDSESEPEVVEKASEQILTLIVFVLTSRRSSNPLLASQLQQHSCSLTPKPLASTPSSRNTLNLTKNQMHLP